MEHESFSDDETAKVLNENFVAIKVDREERPDLDSIYMDVCQMLTGSGGWPLTLFLSPEKTPVFAGTYFPKTEKYGMKGFIDILNDINHIWHNDRNRLKNAGKRIIKIISKHKINEKEITEKNVHNTFLLYKNNFDYKYGGLSGAPKFPTPHTIYFLLRYYKKYKNDEALKMAETTLLQMYKGGIYDHAGFGFCRYSTDSKWLVPHFEKMLYDNALLAIAYTEIYQITGNLIYETIAKEILSFILRDMADDNGGYYTAIDADSEGVEGKFYLWTKKEIIKILPHDFERFCNLYGVKENGNFEGKNILNLINNEIVFLNDLREKIYAEREKRIHPFKDNKILTGQNGMVIAALSIAGRVFNESDYIEHAKFSVSFILNNLMKKGRLLTCFGQGSASQKAFSEDYVYLIWGLLELYISSGENSYLNLADSLNNELIALFWDNQDGGVFINGSDSENLIIRPKERYDNAYPGANSLCVSNFIKLSVITKNSELYNKALAILNCYSQTIENYPLSITHMINGFMLLSETSSIALAGTPNMENYEELNNFLKKRFLPFSTIRFECGNGDYKSINGKAAVYVCSDFTCKPPVTNANELKKIID